MHVRIYHSFLYMHWLLVELMICKIWMGLLCGRGNVVICFSAGFSKQFLKLELNDVFARPVDGYICRGEHLCKVPTTVCRCRRVNLLLPLISPDNAWILASHSSEVDSWMTLVVYPSMLSQAETWRSNIPSVLTNTIIYMRDCPLAYLHSFFVVPGDTLGCSTFSPSFRLVIFARFVASCLLLEDICWLSAARFSTRRFH